jgi:hypothetical protein
MLRDPASMPNTAFPDNPQLLFFKRQVDCSTTVDPNRTCRPEVSYRCEGLQGLLTARFATLALSNIDAITCSSKNIATPGNPQTIAKVA